MKSIIEGSFYAFIMSIFVMISVNFIMVNSRITEKNQELRSIETYMEVNAKSEQKTASVIRTGRVEGNYYIYNNVRYDKELINNANAAQTFTVLTNSSAESLKQAASNMGITLTMDYMDETESYGYIEYEAKYRLVFSVFNFGKDIVTGGMARYIVE